MKSYEKRVEIRGTIVRSNKINNEIIYTIIFGIFVFGLLFFVINVGGLEEGLPIMFLFILAILNFIIRGLLAHDVLCYNNEIYLNYNKIKIIGYKRIFFRLAYYFETEKEGILFIPYMDYDLEWYENKEFFWTEVLDRMQGVEGVLYKQNIPKVKFKFCLSFFIYFIEKISLIAIFILLIIFLF